MKYKYTGVGEVHLPNHKITVSEADPIVEVTEPIENPDFVLITGKPKKKSQEVTNDD